MGRGDGSEVETIDAPARSHQLAPGEFTAKIDFKLFPKVGQAEKSNGFTIAKATITEGEGNGAQVTLKGGYGPIATGATITVSEWREDRDRYGVFRWVNSSHAAEPVTREAVEAYLAHLPGVGPQIAREIVNELGVDCLEKIDRDPAVLLSVKTSSGRSARASLDELSEAWEEMRQNRKTIIALTSMGLGDSAARSAIQYFGPATALQKVTEDPYQLSRVPGIGFRQADAVARKQGLRWEDPRRMGAGCEELLNQGVKQGHICFTEENILNQAPELLRVKGWRPTAEQILEGIDLMESEKRIFREGDLLYSTPNYLMETMLMNHLQKRLTDDADDLPEGFERPEDSPVTDEQWSAVENAFVEKLSILRGSAGTGKTTALRAVLDELDARSQSYICLAPTGKAAKRMEESTGREAKTIHRGLGIGYSEEDDGTSQLIPKSVTADVVIVDESSMIDMRLAESLFRSVSDQTRVVLVGDPDQLPAIGVGSVMHDLIESERVPTTHLTKIFRQAEDSLLLVNANRIRQGEEPFWTAEEAERELGHPLKRDFKFIPSDSSAESERLICEASADMAEKLGVAEDELFVTAATKSGVCGVQSLNKRLRDQRNPSGSMIVDGDWQLNKGDLVMNTKNRYAKRGDEAEVMNGDSGRLIDWDASEGTAWVEFDSDAAGPEPVPFRGGEVKNLIPAFAATTHKLQGSEAPGVITAVNAGVAGRAHRMINRNLLYTALTRASDDCVLVGSKDAIKDALSRDGSKRNTTLDLKVSSLPARLQTRQEILREKQQWISENQGGIAPVAGKSDIEILLGL